MSRPPLLLLLLLVPCLAGLGLWQDSPTPPPGPPQILSEGELGEAWPGEWEEGELSSLPTLEITAVVSRAPEEDEGEWGEEVNTTVAGVEVGGPNVTGVEVGGPGVVVEDTAAMLLLTWWQVLLLVVACLLVCCLCGYLTGCCFLTVSCCSDPYWCCCSCLAPCVTPLKPPPNVSRSSLRKADTHLSTTYSLNESSTAPRRSVERSRGSMGSSRSLQAGQTRLASSLAVAEDTSLATSTLQSSTLQSAKSVRNYKRPPGEAGRLGGLSESQPHVYREDTGSYFSWLHLLGRSSKRYTVTAPRKQQKSTNNNNPVYRQNTRYRHIPDNSRNSAVIPTKISKRSSTASNYRYHMSGRSRSAETVDSLGEGCAPLLESRSERQIPRSRLSANLATLEAGRGDARARRQSGLPSPVPCPTAPLIPEYNLRTFEKSLLKSKETTL